jgi:hypothetical protein
LYSLQFPWLAQAPATHASRDPSLSRFPVLLIQFSSQLSRFVGDAAKIVQNENEVAVNKSHTDFSLFEVLRDTPSRKNKEGPPFLRTTLPLSYCGA